MDKFLWKAILPVLLLFGSVTRASDVLLKIDGEPTGVDEFLYTYQKNNINNQLDFSEESLKDYLNLFVNYKLKVKQAEELGLHQDENLMNEYKGYKRQLLESHIQKLVLNPLIEQEYGRSQYDVGMAHIYVSKNTENAEDKITQAFDALQKGVAFEKVAEQYSEDELSKSKGGFVGYFTALQIGIPSIENALYENEEGAYSDVIETNQGFHIIRSLDKRPARRNIKVAIIKTQIHAGNPDFSKSKIDSAYAELQAGMDFKEAVQKYSEDENSAIRGGELDWFGTNTYVREFEETAYALQRDGDYSEPFSTGSSWYIIQRIKLAEKPQEHEAKAVIKSKLQASMMHAEKMRAFYQELENQYQLEVDEKGASTFKDKLVEMVDEYPFQFEQVDEENVLFSLKGEKYTELDLRDDIVEAHGQVMGVRGMDKVNQLFARVIQEKLLATYEQNLIDSLYEYKSLLAEYRNGVLIFELTKQRVWDKAATDSVGLMSYYKKHGSKYQWNERAEVVRISPKDASSPKSLLKAVKKKKFKTIGQWEDYIAENGEDGWDAEIQFIERGVSEEIENMNWKKGFFVDSEGRIYQVLKVIPAQQKSLSEVRGLVVSEYQTYLEQQWISELRQSFQVEIDDSVLQKHVK